VIFCAWPPRVRKRRPVDIREHDTVEALSPVRRPTPPLHYVFLTAVTLAAAAVVALAAVPGLRREALRLLSGVRARTVPLRITSTPEGADVFVDEQPAGATPTRADVAPGRHKVRIVRRGYEPWRQVVDPLATPELAPALEPLALATLVVESRPDRASVFLDGEHRGLSPLTIPNVEAGAHTVRVGKEPLYQAVAEHVELQGGETRRLVVRLESSLERLYRSRIKEKPKQLSNYTELLHLYVLNADAEKAMGVVAEAVNALQSAEAPAAELRQFYEELRAIYGGRGGPIDDASRTRVLDCVILLFEKIALANPAEHTTYQPLVALLGEAGRDPDVAKVCEKAVGNDETKGLLHYYVAQMYLDWGKPVQAIGLLERAVELKPSHLHATMSLGSAYHRAERYDDALRQYQAAEKIAATGSAYYQGLLQTYIARLLVSRKDIPGAVARYQKAIAAQTAAAYTCQWRLQFAELLAENGRKKEAIEQYREIARLLPDSKLGYAAARAIRRLEGE